MKNLKVLTKMSLVGCVVMAFIVFSICFSITNMKSIENQAVKAIEQYIRADYDNNIKSQVDLAISLLDTYNADIQAGIYSKEEGMKLAADKLRDLRYGEDGYFWADQPDGTNVVLLGSDTEGTNRMD
ncbi:MAG TPA: methyl-accepting chemotaxis protein, partial [Lachnospiraceae bacterium]|nr:methyl-accepting chemotaxis protein [Lachnospiraceae bacterium]